MYDFDQVIDRTPHYSAKFDPKKEGLENGLYNNDYIYMQTADMDFVCSDGIRQEMQKVVDYNLYGYSKCTHEYCGDVYDVIAHWLNKRQRLDLKPKNIFYGRGVLGAVQTTLEAFLRPGEKVLVNLPLYDPLIEVASYLNQGNEVVNSQLLRDSDGKYILNYEEIEQITADPQVTIYLFCNPHNPTGRVWTEEELRRVHDICQRNHVLFISDEVHSDFVWGNNRFVSALSATDGKGVVVCTGLAKTFNLAGLSPAFSVATDPELLDPLEKANVWSWPSPFTVAAIKGACLNSDDWLEQILAYVKGNMDAAADFIQTHMPKVKWYYPEGTYTFWLDFSGYGYSDEELHERIYARAKVIMHDGTWFDKEHGQGFQRLCVPMPRARMLEALQRVVKELE